MRNKKLTLLLLFDQKGIIASGISQHKKYTAIFNGAYKVTKWMNVGLGFGYLHINTTGIGGLYTEYGGILTSVVNPTMPAVVADSAFIVQSPYFPSSVNLDDLAIVKDADGKSVKILEAMQ